MTEIVSTNLLSCFYLSCLVLTPGLRPSSEPFSTFLIPNPWSSEKPEQLIFFWNQYCITVGAAHQTSDIYIWCIKWKISAFLFFHFCQKCINLCTVTFRPFSYCNQEGDKNGCCSGESMVWQRKGCWHDGNWIWIGAILLKQTDKRSNDTCGKWHICIFWWI